MFAIFEKVKVYYLLRVVSNAYKKDWDCILVSYTMELQFKLHRGECTKLNSKSEISLKADFATSCAWQVR